MPQNLWGNSYELLRDFGFFSVSVQLFRREFQFIYHWTYWEPTLFPPRNLNVKFDVALIYIRDKFSKIQTIFQKLLSNFSLKPLGKGFEIYIQW